MIFPERHEVDISKPVFDTQYLYTYLYYLSDRLYLTARVKKWCDEHGIDVEVENKGRQVVAVFKDAGSALIFHMNFIAGKEFKYQ